MAKNPHVSVVNTEILKNTVQESLAFIILHLLASNTGSTVGSGNFSEIKLAQLK